MDIHDNPNAGAAKLPWTDDRVELLKRLWAEGLSASQIAARLGQGVTRNAVIGKVHRLGLSGRVTKTRVTTPRPRKTREPSHPGGATFATANGQAVLKARSEPKPAPIPEPQPIRLVDRPQGERVSILMLTDKTCRWPIGDPGSAEFCFCGHLPKAGAPYCEYHARIAYQPAQDRRRRAHG